ncbi:MAG: protein kinase, partial [Chloroflexota bacterium]
MPKFEVPEDNETMLRPELILGGIYRLEKQLGKGAMGEVWLAQHLLLNQPRAIKVMLGGGSGSSKLRERFIQGEARNSLRLEHHPNIVRVYELGLYENMPYIVMEYVECGSNGANLSELLRVKGHLTKEDAGEILAQLASALESAHRQAMIHRDIKPANILLDTKGQAKLTDFGLIKDLNAEEDLTLGGYAMGTPSYMSPEQALGEADPRSDIYSLGVLTYHMLAGRPPFEGTTAEILKKHATTLPPPLEKFNPNLPPALSAVILKALAKQPEERYQSAWAMHLAYQQVLKGKQEEATAPTVALQENLSKSEVKQKKEPAPSVNLTAKTKDNFPNNLPQQPNSLVGRKQEIVKVKHLLVPALQAGSRILTLTGSGGTGKTRLALQVATELLANFEQGVWWIELAPLTDPTLIPQAIARALDVSEQPDKPILTTLQDFLKTRRCLLVLDNCEHMIESSARLVDSLVRVCPHLQVLATSREALNINGEITFGVPSLSLPNQKQLPPIEKLPDYEAVRLFIDRVVAINQKWSITNQNAPVVVELCHRLDGIPLAIELAAARIKMMTVEQILSKLNDRFRLLTSGSRIALPRQQTLRALIDWSYDLLSDGEKVLLCRLGIFYGGWTLEAAEQVCSSNPLEDYEVMDYLSQLVNKSLVVVDGTEASEARYHLLETIRQYTQEKLKERGETETFNLRHTEYYLALVEEADQYLRGSEQVPWLTRLDQEHDNLRGALNWLLKPAPSSAGGSGRSADRPEMTLQFSGKLFGFWFLRGYFSEGRHYLEAALNNPT